MPEVEFDRKTIADDLAEAEGELHAWVTGSKSHWNALHGSQTGDYAAQYERTASADAAEIQKLTNSVIALRLLADSALRTATPEGNKE